MSNIEMIEDDGFVMPTIDGVPLSPCELADAINERNDLAERVRELECFIERLANADTDSLIVKTGYGGESDYIEYIKTDWVNEATDLIDKVLRDANS